MEGRADQYRRLARECLELTTLASSSVSTEPARSMLIEMARVWARLADELEAAQPVVQQQQQIQPKKDGGG